MKFIVYYCNGYIESIDRLTITFLHLVEIGVAKFIIDVEKGEGYYPVGDGTHKKAKVTQVSGLS